MHIVVQDLDEQWTIFVVYSLRRGQPTRPDDASRGDGGLFMVGYYARPDGQYEKVFMPTIDFYDALERFPEEWSESPPPPGSQGIDTPMSRLIQARERERLAKNPPTTNPAPFTLEQMNRLSDLDKIQISHYQKNNPGMSRAQIAAHLDAVIRNGWLKQR